MFVELVCSSLLNTCMIKTASLVAPSCHNCQPLQNKGKAEITQVCNCGAASDFSPDMKSHAYQQ